MLGAVAILLSGCAAVGVPSHVSGTALAAKQLAAALGDSPGVVSASAAYNPADLAGESVHVRAQLTASAGPTEWIRLIDILRPALTHDPITQTRRFVTVTERGGSGPELTLRQPNVALPTPTEVRTAFTQWHQLAAGTGAGMSFDLAPGTGWTKFRLVSRTASARYMAGSGTGFPAHVELLGDGFDATGAPPAAARTAYRLLSASLAPQHSTSDRAASTERFMVDWSELGVAAGLHAARSAGNAPSQSDAALAVHLFAAARAPTFSVVWLGSTHSAWVTLGSCPAHTTRKIHAKDLAFARQVSAIEPSLSAAAIAGECLPSA